MPTLNITGNLVVQTAAQWAADATVYSTKKILITSDATYSGTDQRKFKIADGTQTWSNLDYFGEFGTTAGTWAQGNDSRFTDTRYRKYIDYDNVSHGVTGTLSETILVGDLTIPAGTLGANDSFTIRALFGATGTANTKVFRVYINTIPNDLTGATIIGVVTFAATNLSGGFTRTISNKNSVSLNEVFPPTQTAASDMSLSTVAVSTLNYDFANTAYIIITGDLANIADTATCHNVQLPKDGI